MGKASRGKAALRCPVRVVQLGHRRVLRLAGWSESDAQDAAAEVFSTAWRRLDELPEGTPRECGRRRRPEGRSPTSGARAVARPPCTSAGRRGRGRRVREPPPRPGGDAGARGAWPPPASATARCCCWRSGGSLAGADRGGHGVRDHRAGAFCTGHGVGSARSSRPARPRRRRQPRREAPETSTTSVPVRPHP